MTYQLWTFEKINTLYTDHFDYIDKGRRVSVKCNLTGQYIT